MKTDKANAPPAIIREAQSAIDFLMSRLSQHHADAVTKTLETVFRAWEQEGQSIGANDWIDWLPDDTREIVLQLCNEYDAKRMN